MDLRKVCVHGRCYREGDTLNRIRPMPEQRLELQVLQGTLDVLVLQALSGGASHGYAITRWIRSATDDELQVEDRALYVALHRMEEHGWVESDWGLTENNRRAKYYALTTEGKRELARGARWWRRYSAAVGKVLATQPAR